MHPDAYEVLQWLASKDDLIRGIISAGITVKQAEKLIRLRIYEFLTPNAIFFTDQIGISKPNPKLMRRVTSDLKLDPSRVLYVGDHPTHDIDPAKEAGLIAVHSRRSGKHIGLTGVSEPDWVIRDFYELRRILETEFGLGN